MPSTAISEQIKVLAELQKIDTELFHLKKELAAQPAAEKKHTDDFEKKKAGVKAAEDTLKACQLKQKEKEGELAAKEEKVKKLQGQLYQLKSNKEYTAMELEIKGLKADDSLLEEEILKLIDEVDAAKARVAKEKELLAVEEKKMKEELGAIQKRGVDLQGQAAALEEKRKTYVPNIDPKLLAQYEKVLKSREGVALVPVKNNSCGGCHIGLPPQRVAEIMTADKIIVCEDCARILYWPS